MCRPSCAAGGAPARRPRPAPARCGSSACRATPRSWPGTRKLQKYHETQLTAEELGLPEAQWFTTEDDVDAKGRPIKRKVERRVGTREVSLLGSDAGAKRLDLPQLAGGDPRPFEVVGIPLAEPGYHVVEIESLRLGQALLDKRAPMYVRTGVLVTNLGVHFKLGRENSVVWVTTLDRGKPVAGADVAVNDCAGKPLWTGRTDAKASRVVGPRARRRRCDDCAADAGYFVTARKADDEGGATTSPSSSATGRRASSRGASTCRPAAAPSPTCAPHTVFDRTLLRAGETVSMKHFIRTETATGLAARAGGELPTRVKIVHQGSGQEFTQPLQWNGGGRSAATTWNIPPAAKLGVYEVVARARAADARRVGGERAKAARSAAGRAATSASRSSACRWSTRA